jgi:preprotein translocase subunit SecA
MVTKAIERARKQVEYNNFSIRKNLVEYDNVMNSQRVVIYERRTEFLKGKDLREEARELVGNVIEDKVWEHCPEKTHWEEWNLMGLREEMRKIFLMDFQFPQDYLEKAKQPDIIEKLNEAAIRIYDDKEEILSEDIMRRLERFAFLSVFDTQWKEHLYEMDHLKTGIGLRAYGQRDPVIEYKKEAYGAFQEMMGRIDQETCPGARWWRPSSQRWGWVWRSARNSNRPRVKARASMPAPWPRPPNGETSRNRSA